MFGKKKEPKFKFNLGDAAKDIITGFAGIIISRSQWIHNCNIYGLKSKELKDSKPIDTQWFDESQLEIIKKEIVKKKQRTGGPCEMVPQTNR